MDMPFIEKINELSAAGTIIVSAIGNDGPLYGTLNNPADMMDVIGVGGISNADTMAPFSSRGMTTHELPHGYGRPKPDIVTYGQNVVGSQTNSGCRTLSGTSVASPVVAGAVTLLASSVPEETRWQVVNPASMKQVLVESAVRLFGPNVFEQGAGKLNLVGAYELLQSYTPRASLHPSTLDLMDCPYMWPFCTQEIYIGMMPVVINATILNGMGVTGHIVPGTAVYRGDASKGGHVLQVSFQYSERIWPWSGYFAVFVRVHEGKGVGYTGHAAGTVEFVVESPAMEGEASPRRSTVQVPSKVMVIEPPPREKRILLDVRHSLRYPPGYLPRDRLEIENDVLDWNGDHPHTNLRGLYSHLKQWDFYVEILTDALTCFDAARYGALMLVDPEDEYAPEEIAKLASDVEAGLGLVVLADWYDPALLKHIRFWDDNTRSMWDAVTGGSNVPALNDLLAPFGVQFGGRVFNGQFSIVRGEAAKFGSGVPIVQAPAGAFVHKAALTDQTASILRIGGVTEPVAILALFEHSKGRVVAFGDSSCVDDSHLSSPCFAHVHAMLSYASANQRDDALFAPSAMQSSSFYSSIPLPTRIDPERLEKLSYSAKHGDKCYKLPETLPPSDSDSHSDSDTDSSSSDSAATVTTPSPSPDPAAGVQNRDGPEQQTTSATESKLPPPAHRISEVTRLGGRSVLMSLWLSVAVVLIVGLFLIYWMVRRRRQRVIVSLLP
eukprot:TRINITY_DN3490_c0_g2_i1.p1 TRINITY_DN3490_c0_g2~~TRINITY_DN3490_c0_g2_i1.p1  ORF type:complete len:722 (-),score=154.10 TRINITY_DN3490_c0_g2_i1:32-2197(-)